MLASTAPFAAPYVRAETLIVDTDGQVKVIIDFAFDAHLKYPGALPVLPGRDLLAKPKEFFHTEKTLALVADYERRYGFTRLGMTSWVGNSVTAYLTATQIDALGSDPLVKLISDDWESSLSAYPYLPSLANDITSGNEITSWGRTLVNGKSKYSYIDRKIYVIDNGVSYHNDLPYVTRTNVACGSGGGCENVINPNLNGTLYPVTGCFGHATHVAGIIGAVGNGSGTIGAYAGATMVSLNVTVGQAVGSFPNYTASECTVSSPTVTSVGYALDYMYQQVLYSGQLAVANISINAAGLGVKSSATPEPNWSKVKNVATPAYRSDLGINYPGVFVAQSAGNGARPLPGIGQPDGPPSDACYWNSNGDPTGFKPLPWAPYALDDDGIMVVGAIHNAGRDVSSAEPFSPPSTNQVSTPNPSNYGRCVDIWAPGDYIVSAWNSSASGREWLSGTSMAAPHVAAAAAYFADYEGLSTPGAIEQRIRSASSSWGDNDVSGQPVTVVHTP